MRMINAEVNSHHTRRHFRGRSKKPALLAGPCLRWLPLIAALLLATILAACGGDAAPGEDATTAPTTTEATERESAPPSGSVATDREVLVALYNATDGPNWTYSNNWLSDLTLGAWEGVTANIDGRVTELDLGDNELSGEIPAELGSLSNLTWLDLSSTALSGEIPAELGSLSNLTHLDLSHIQLSGEIPAWLGSLSNLTWLDLTINDLSGCVPSSLEDQLASSYDNFGGLPLC